MLKVPLRAHKDMDIYSHNALFLSFPVRRKGTPTRSVSRPLSWPWNDAGRTFIKCESSSGKQSIRALHLERCNDREGNANSKWQPQWLSPDDDGT